VSKVQKRNEGGCTKQFRLFLITFCCSVGSDNSLLFSGEKYIKLHGGSPGNKQWYFIIYNPCEKKRKSFLKKLIFVDLIIIFMYN